MHSYRVNKFTFPLLSFHRKLWRPNDYHTVMWPHIITYYSGYLLYKTMELLQTKCAYDNAMTHLSIHITCNYSMAIYRYSILSFGIIYEWKGHSVMFSLKISSSDKHEVTFTVRTSFLQTFNYFDKIFLLVYHIRIWKATHNSILCVFYLWDRISFCSVVTIVRSYFINITEAKFTTFYIKFKSLLYYHSF